MLFYPRLAVVIFPRAGKQPASEIEKHGDCELPRGMYMVSHLIFIVKVSVPSRRAFR